MTHDYDDARDGHEDKDRKAARLNSHVAMLRLVMRDPQNLRFQWFIKAEIADALAELRRLGAEVWEANTKPIPDREVLGFRIHHDHIVGTRARIAAVR